MTARIVTGLFALLMGTGCAAKRLEPCDKPPPFHLTLEASDRVNPDRRGRSMPTLVQVLQLKDGLRAEQEGFRSLWNKPEAVLKDDLLQVSELTVAPGQSVERWISRDPKAHVVVVMGLFFQPSGWNWRTMTVLPSVPRNLCTDEQALGRAGQPRATDERLRFKLQGYQIEPLRTTSSAAGGLGSDGLDRGLTPPWSKT
ncbi:type VI secretion system lipoprotein TssJ [Archangium primigenium]|uniref:type VI secretion system lipoprotein TssJ n=1 Tax=[Archangium] primigenium TaxID=2792470 RepID=UPI0030842E2A